jgi:hypothetical protein
MNTCSMQHSTLHSFATPTEESSAMNENDLLQDDSSWTQAKRDKW